MLKKKTNRRDIIMVEGNARFGVVNNAMRIKYEKEFQVSYGYDFISFNKYESIVQCKKLSSMNNNDSNWIVERIFDTSVIKNNQEEIFRSGDFKEGKDEKNN